MLNTSNPNPSDDVPPERRHELDIKEREVAAKEREVAAKELEVRRSRWSHPLVIAVFCTALGLGGNIVVAFVNNRATLEVTSANNKATQDVESQREQSNLVLEAIKTKDPNDVCKNLVFFVKLKLLDDPDNDIKQQCASAPKGLPSLPPPVAVPTPATAPEKVSMSEPIQHNPELLIPVSIGLLISDSDSKEVIAGASVAFTKFSPYSPYATNKDPGPTLTGPAGNVIFPFVPGDYIVVISKDTYTPETRRFAVHDTGFTLEVSISKAKK